MFKNLICPSCKNNNFKILMVNDTKQLVFICDFCKSRLITLDSCDTGISKFMDWKKW